MALFSDIQDAILSAGRFVSGFCNWSNGSKDFKEFSTWFYTLANISPLINLESPIGKYVLVYTRFSLKLA